MSAELIMRPGITIASRGDFISSHPPYAVALDGYVNAPPFFERTPQGPYRNFDHHTGVDRLATLSSAQQVLRAIRMGFVAAFMRDGEYCPTVYANDCDQDIALAWYLLLNAPDIAAIRVKKLGAPLRNLVDMAGDLDVTGGAYPYPPRLALMRQVAYIFRPFTDVARARQELRRDDPEQYKAIIGECAGRIALFLDGNGQEVRLDTRRRTLGKGKGWRMIQELGAEGRIGAFSNPRNNASIFYKGERGESGIHDYALWRRSEYIDFDWFPLVEHLNRLEGLEGVDRWGMDGSGNNGGSPREAGTRIDPYTLMDIMRGLPLANSRR